MTRFEEYAIKYQTIKMQRRDGILEVTLHSNSGALLWNESVHRELPYACTDISADPDNKVVILTGTGDTFCAEVDSTSFGGGLGTPRGWDKIYWEGKRLLMHLLDTVDCQLDTMRPPSLPVRHGQSRPAQSNSLCKLNRTPEPPKPSTARFPT